MATVTPKVCSDMTASDVLNVPGDFVQVNGVASRVIRSVLTLLNDNTGPMLLPNGAELVVPAGVTWAVRGVLAGAKRGGTAGEYRVAEFTAHVRRTTAGSAAIQFSTGAGSTVLLSTPGSNVFRVSADSENADAYDWTCLVEIVEAKDAT